MTRLQALYDWGTTKVLDRLRDPLLLVIRLLFGYELATNGWGKLHNLDNVAKFFATRQIPMPELTARFVGGLELVSGVLLFIGLASRLISIPLAVNMFVAIVSGDKKDWGSIDGFTGDAAFPYLMVALIVLAFGPGLFSLDALLRKKFKPAVAPQLAAAAMLAILFVSLPLHAAPPPRAVATFAAGCFWCSEAAFDSVPGVIGVLSGYTGGNVNDPSYEQVSSGGTGHREAVQVTFDPAKVSYEKLLDIFWHNVDPFDQYGQFCDKGEQYKGAIYYHGEEQHRAAIASRDAVQKRFPKQRVVTDIIAASRFYPAEEYHQQYHIKNPIRYKYYRHGCGRDARLAQIWGR